MVQLQDSSRIRGQGWDEVEAIGIVENHSCMLKDVSPELYLRQRGSLITY